MIEYTEDYLAFYEEYPRHEGKQDGQKAWNSLSDSQRAAALADVRKRKRAGAYSKNKKLIQLPASYLRAGRWEDDWQDTVESSRKHDDGMVSRGTVSYQPMQDEFTGGRWLARANRRMREWLFSTERGLAPEKLQQAVIEKNRIAREYGPAFDEDLEAGADPREVADEFDGAVFSALDKIAGLNLRHRMMRKRSGK